MKLDLYIANLLKDHDCVIVPDFGGFVANYSSAKINSINHKFDPPSRKISYNKYLIHNDGLLAAYVAQKEHEQYETALQSVKEYAVYLKEELKEKKQVSIEKVGVLYQQQNGTLRFEQVKNPALFVEGFGLESFFAKPAEKKLTSEPLKKPEVSDKPAVKDEPKVIPMTVVSEDNDQKPEEKRKVAWWPAAAALALPLIGYTLWVSMGTPLFSNASEFHYSDLNPFSEKICTTYQFRNGAIDEADLSAPKEVVLPESGFATVYQNLEADKTLVVSVGETKSKAETNKALRYHIVGGCFSMFSNAKDMIKSFQNKGTNASLIDQKGKLFRVSIESFATKKEAADALASYQNEIPGAWILYK